MEQGARGGRPFALQEWRSGLEKYRNRCRSSSWGRQRPTGSGGRGVEKDLDFDLLAAGLRADLRDAGSFLEVLAGKLEGALPRQTRVVRKGGLFRQRHPVQAMEVDLGTLRFGIGIGGRGTIEATRSKIVRDITLKTEPLPLEEWIADLSRHLAEAARENAAVREALERFLIGG